MTEMPDFIRRAMEAQGKVNPDDVLARLADDTVIPSDEVDVAEQQGHAPEPDLSDAERAMIQEPLPLPDHTEMGQWSDPGSSGAPDTQRLAAISVYPTSGTARRTVLDYIVGCGDSGATDDEMEFRLGMRHQSVSARRYELHRDGWIEDSGKRRVTRSGRDAAVWTLTAQGRAELARLA